MLTAAVLFMLPLLAAPLPVGAAGIVCVAPRAIDGDTVACANLAAHIRLIGIDAPEMPGHCRPGRVCTPGNPWRSRRLLAALLRTGPAIVHPAGVDRYQRTLARMSANGRDVSCQMLAWRAAVPRYRAITC